MCCFCRLPQEIFQTAKVSKLLLAINSGKATEDLDFQHDILSSDSEDDQNHLGVKKFLKSRNITPEDNLPSTSASGFVGTEQCDLYEDIASKAGN